MKPTRRTDPHVAPMAGGAGRGTSVTLLFDPRAEDDGARRHV
jgi:hypothetical protein